MLVCQCVLRAGVHCVGGMSGPGSREGGGGSLLEKAGAVRGLREKRGHHLRAELQWKVTDKTFSKCRVICGSRFWV